MVVERPMNVFQAFNLGRVATGYGYVTSLYMVIFHSKFRFNFDWSKVNTLKRFSRYVKLVH